MIFVANDFEGLECAGEVLESFRREDPEFELL